MTPACFAALLVLSAGAPPDAPPPSAPPAQDPAPALAPISRAAPVAALAPAASTPPSAPVSAAAAPAPTGAPAAARTGAATAAQPGPYSASAEGPDVELHVPKAEVQKLSLDVENLQARLDIDTSVAQLVTIHAGVVATVQKLKAELDGVSAETHLIVRLNRVADVMNRALAAIDDKPQLAGNAAVPPAGATVPAAGVAADAAVVPGPSANPRPAPALTKPPME